MGAIKVKALNDFFKENKRIALAFSGGVDSSFLLYAAIRYGAEVRAYYVKTAFQPKFELEDAKHLAKELGADMTILSADVLAETEIVSNPADRCYFCKNFIFRTILKQAREDGFTAVMDGTNASDDAGDRPGMQALKELSVKSPLRECGLTKEEIRSLSKEAGLFTWDKPAYACLATRIATGTPICEADLIRTEEGERFMSGLGFRDFRIRLLEDGAKLQIRAGQLPLLVQCREELLTGLKKYYKSVVLDLEVRE